jgi:coenzyme F420-reducing hydrogenase beta subunit
MSILQKKIEIGYCTGCAACYNICPQRCIKMVQTEEGFYHPEIDLERCTNCNMCRTICPALNYSVPPFPSLSPLLPPAYAVINNNEETRSKSSSGGAFSLLAEEIILQGGVVFGVKFDKDFSVVHGYTETVEGIKNFRRSKYVQSRVGESYKECLRFLDQGRIVLFSGTPCQIGGLKAYLQQRECHNLYCIDLVCSSISSPAVWEKYLNKLELAQKAKSKNIFFRDKSGGGGGGGGPCKKFFYC